MSSTVIFAGSDCSGDFGDGLASGLVWASAHPATAVSATAAQTFMLDLICCSPFNKAKSLEQNRLPVAPYTSATSRSGSTPLTDSHSRNVALCWLAAALLWFGPLGYRDLVHPDEGRYSEIS